MWFKIEFLLTALDPKYLQLFRYLIPTNLFLILKEKRDYEVYKKSSHIQ